MTVIPARTTRGIMSREGLALSERSESKGMKNPGLAAVLSAIIPGLGQFYNGDFLRGIFWLIITPGMWIGTGGLLGWVCHVIAAITAYSRANKKNAVRTPA